ncbi:hypothetical protein lerEdw1_019358 [Lerista edwardsae]|nr:hypothetical protein lerEdw1_019358 [Lerista edwardsae]
MRATGGPPALYPQDLACVWEVQQEKEVGHSTDGKGQKLSEEGITYRSRLTSTRTGRTLLGNSSDFDTRWLNLNGAKRSGGPNARWRVLRWSWAQKTLRSETEAQREIVYVPSMEAQCGEDGRRFHVMTPLLESIALSQVAGTKVWMKMENAQPTGSFKIRGISYFCQQVAKKGGNAGLAAAYSAQKLGIPATIIVPESTARLTVKRLQDTGAEVELFGKVWDDANTRATALAEEDGWVNIHPFDHPLVWKGHNSIVHEMKDTLEAKPGAIVLSVGGGGLLSGVVSGLQEVGWLDVPIVAVETRGADSYNAAIKAGCLVTLPDITSVAKCLGANTVAQRALDCAKECPIISHVVEDVEAVSAVEQFLDDERVLVEPACGASLALLYSGHLQRLQEEGRLSRGLDSVVVIVCGGSSIRMEELRAFKRQLCMT